MACRRATCGDLLSEHGSFPRAPRGEHRPPHERHHQRCKGFLRATPGIGPLQQLPREHRKDVELYKQKCGIWNPRNGDHECFAWCIRAHMAGVENWTAEERNHSTRLRHPLFFKEGFAPLRRSGRPLRNELLVPHDFGLNLTGLPQDRGVTLQDIQDFEDSRRSTPAFTSTSTASTRSSSVGLATASGSCGARRRERPKRPHARREAAGVQRSLRLDPQLQCLLRIPGRLSMEGSRKKSHKSAFTCPRCRANFNTAANLEKHQEMPCHWDPSRRVTPLRMPDPQKWEQLLRYKTSASAELSPLTFYADLEVSSDRPPSETVERITHRLQRRVASAAYLSVGHNGYLPSRRCWLDVMRAEDGPYAVVERFLTSLLRVWLKTRDQQ